MEVTVRGTYPGNTFDMTPYIHLSDYSDNFTSDNIYQYRRSIRISIEGMTASQRKRGELYIPAYLGRIRCLPSKGPVLEYTQPDSLRLGA